jgi:ketosteroid isomerase-like protein
MSATASVRRTMVMVFVFASALHTLPTAAQSNTPDDVEPIRRATEHFLEVFGNLDWDGFRAVWSSEPTVFFPFNDAPERVTGKNAVEARWQRFFSEMPRRTAAPPYFRVNLRDLLIQRYGDAAIVTFNLGTTPGAVGRRTLVFVREKGEWKLAHLHGSPLADATR